MMPSSLPSPSVPRQKKRRPRRRREAGGRGGCYGNWQQQQASPVASPSTDINAAYFHAYSQIKDHVCTKAYRAAIMRYQHLIFDKVVLDVGCGTGLLAIFCVIAGARQVYAVEASCIAVQADKIVKENNLCKVTVLHGRVEDISIKEKVDVIISNWMGQMLLYESLLPSIIFCRDKWLKPGGLILPSQALLFMAPVTHSDRYRESIDFWHNVYNINMSAMLPLAKQCAFEEPCVETMSAPNVLTCPILVKKVDCYTVTIQELKSLTTNFSVSSTLQAPLHGFAFWFDAIFDGPAIDPSDHHLQPHQLPPGASLSDQQSQGSNDRISPDPGILLSTAPGEDPTRWQQTVLYLYDPIVLRQDQKIGGFVTLSLSEANRLNILLEFSSEGQSSVREAVMR